MDLHGRIFDYWKDKCITYKGTIEIEGNYDYSKSIEVVKDWGEPNCWLCGKIINLDDYPFYYEDLENGKLTKIWNYGKVRNILNRCHIVPKALGGSDTADNLFLLCQDCHAKSPDTNNPKYFFQYIYNERKKFYLDGNNMTNIINKYLNLCIRNGKDCRTLDIKNNNLEINTHGVYLSESTIISKLLDSTKDYQIDDTNEYMEYIETLKKLILKNRKGF